MASVTRSAMTSPGRGQSPSSAIAKEAVESRGHDARVFTLHAADVPESCAQFDRTVNR